MFYNPTYGYTFAPKLAKDMQDTQIRGYLDNGYNILKFEIKVNVINDPPYLKDGPPNDVYVTVDNEATIILSQYEDRENLTVTL